MKCFSPFIPQIKKVISVSCDFLSGGKRLRLIRDDRSVAITTKRRIERRWRSPRVNDCKSGIKRLRFIPALDDRGRPIAYQLDYVATWRL